MDMGLSEIERGGCRFLHNCTAHAQGHGKEAQQLPSLAVVLFQATVHGCEHQACYGS